MIWASTYNKAVNHVLTPSFCVLNDRCIKTFWLLPALTAATTSRNRWESIMRPAERCCVSSILVRTHSLGWWSSVDSFFSRRNVPKPSSVLTHWSWYWGLQSRPCCRASTPSSEGGNGCEMCLGLGFSAVRRYDERINAGWSQMRVGMPRHGMTPKCASLMRSEPAKSTNWNREVRMACVAYCEDGRHN